MGFCLYNMGFTAGLIGVLVVALSQVIWLRARPGLCVDHGQ